MFVAAASQYVLVLSGSEMTCVENSKSVTRMHVQHADCLEEWSSLTRVDAGVDSNGAVVIYGWLKIHCEGCRLIVQKQANVKFALIRLLFLCTPMFW